MLAPLLTGLRSVRLVHGLIPLALAISISSGASAQQREVAFIVNSTTLDGRSCLSLPWPNAIWVAPRVPVVGDRVLFGTSCNNATVRQITASTPLTQQVVTCNGLPGDTAQQCSARGEGSEPLSTYLSAAPLVPTATLSANPLSVAYGGSSTLTWSSTNATACTSSGAWTGPRAVSGTLSVPIAGSMTFSLSCSGAGGVSPTVSVTVTAAPAPPVVTFAANPTSVVLGNSSTLTWDAQNATSCTAGGAWSGTLPVSGTQQTARLSANATYSLTCQGPGGYSDVAIASVTVTGPTAPVCVPQQFGGTGSPFIYRDTKLPDGSTDPTGPAALVFYCGTQAHWIAGSPITLLLQMQAVWNAVPWRATTDAERAFVLQLLEDTRPGS